MKNAKVDKDLSEVVFNQLTKFIEAEGFVSKNTTYQCDACGRLIPKVHGAGRTGHRCGECDDRLFDEQFNKGEKNDYKL